MYSLYIHYVCTQVAHIRKVVSARTVVEEMSGAAEPQEFQGTAKLYCAVL